MKPPVLICVYAAQNLLRTVDASVKDTDAFKGTGLDLDFLGELGMADRLAGWTDLVRKLKKKAEEGNGK